MKCLNCSNGAKFGCKYCVDCLDKAKCRSAKRYENIKKEKKCKSCSSFVEGKGVYCEICRCHKRDTWSKRKENGLCVTCGKEKASNGLKCLKCYNAYKQNVKSRREKRLLEGLCAFCDNPRIHTRLCLDHYLKFTSKAHFGTSKKYRELHELFQKQKGICTYSGRLLVLGIDASLDHIIPKSRGGSNGLDNLHWVHQDVNFMKQCLLEEEFLSLIEEIFHHRLPKTESFV